MGYDKWLFRLFTYIMENYRLQDMSFLSDDGVMLTFFNGDTYFLTKDALFLYYANFCIDNMNPRYECKDNFEAVCREMERYLQLSYIQKIRKSS